MVWNSGWHGLSVLAAVIAGLVAPWIGKRWLGL